MNNEYIKRRLLDVHNALTEKLGKQPYISPMLICSNDTWRCTANGTHFDDDIDGDYHADPIGALDGIMAKIDAMPDPEDRALHEFQKMAAKLIDFGNKNQIDAKWLNPIVETAREMAENAITHVK